MKVLVVTDILYTIKVDLILQLEDSEYNISIKEVGPSIQVIQDVQTKSKPLSTEAIDSNDHALGFEDIESNMESDAETNPNVLEMSATIDLERVEAIVGKTS